MDLYFLQRLDFLEVRLVLPVRLALIILHRNFLAVHLGLLVHLVLQDLLVHLVLRLVLRVHLRRYFLEVRLVLRAH